MDEKEKRIYDLKLQAYDLLKHLKDNGVSKKKTVDLVSEKFGISKNTLFPWYSEDIKPWGRRKKLANEPELFYVLGALLGDGCLYRWRFEHQVILVGSKKFCQKFAKNVSRCIDFEVKAYMNRKRNHWFVKVNNFKLYLLFKRIRDELDFIHELAYEKEKIRYLLFIEGFFDAEGCVKIINDSARKTPKICLDITNTDKQMLDLVKNMMRKTLGIESSYSVQKQYVGSDGFKRKTAYHLRIYKKEHVRTFFENIITTKLHKRKIKYLEAWLNNGLGS